MSDTTNAFVSNQCTPAIRTDIQRHGLMTACNAVVPIPSDLDTLYKSDDDFRLMTALFLFQMEGNANQAVQSNLSKFFMANKVNVSKRLHFDNLQGDLMMIRPYALLKRKGVINNNYWKAENGAAANADGTLNPSGAYWRMDFSSVTSIPKHAGWFNLREWIFVTGLDGSGNAIKWAGEVVKSVVSGNYVQVTLKPQMNNSSLPSARKANPTKGGATRGAPNVSDFESYCQQEPGLLTSTFEPYWIGETRTTFKEDELYNKWRDLVLKDNILYRELFDLTTSEYNKQVAENFYKKQIESMFNNTALANQDVTTIDQLETITTSSDSVGGARCVGKRANPIGVYEQHVQCERVVDAQGLKLNLPALFQALYKMSRIRKGAGAPAGAINTFELAMPSTYAVTFHQGMLEYYNTQWRGKVQWNMDIVKSGVAPMGFKYKEYPLVWPDGMIIRVITDDYFDDYAAFMHQLAVDFNDTNWDNLGRRIWIADWSSIYLGIFETNRYTNAPGSKWNLAQDLGVADPCVPRTVKEMNTITTFKWTVVADRTPGNLIIENLSAERPEHDDIGDVNYDENS